MKNGQYWKRVNDITFNCEWSADEKSENVDYKMKLFFPNGDNSDVTSLFEKLPTFPAQNIVNNLLTRS